MFTTAELDAATALVHRHMDPTACHAWPLLAQAAGTEVWVKHENHAPTGAFKVRGGITLVDWLRRAHPGCPGVITATRGNHGQSQARAARAAGLRAVVYVPQGNAPGKNAAMRAFGAELVVFGADFDAAREEVFRVAADTGLFPVPPFHRELVRGVASYAVEMFRQTPQLDTVYVPIGCGSGICGVIAARDAMSPGTEIVGVVSDRAQTARLSAEAGRPVPTDTARTFADGLAVRVPVAEALAIYGPGAARIVAVTEPEIAAAIRLYLAATHNLAEGAGAAPLAALLAERDRMAGRRVGVILCGGNLGADWLRVILEGGVPVV
jgi:threonine dehydratase